MQQSSAEQPDWSLNSAKTKTASAKNYGDWNGAGAPKPFTDTRIVPGQHLKRPD